MVTQYINNIRPNWKSAWSSSAFRNQFVLTIMAFVAANLHNFYFLRLWQGRSGTQVNDLLLNLLPPHDFSVPIFILEYSCMLLVFLFTLGLPERLLKGLQMFALLIFARTVAIYLVPLEAPRDMIALQDPMATLFLHTKEIFVTKDLFFSGHVSALAMFMLIARFKWLKNYVAFCVVAVGGMIMCQHVHYSMDVFFAPLISFFIYKGVLWVHQETKYGIQVQEANQNS